MKVRRSNRFRSRRLLAKKSLRSLKNSRYLFNKASYSSTCHLRTDYGVQSVAVSNAIKELKKKGDTKQLPSELLRRDFISAMKLPDNGVVSPDLYWNISDQWKSEWDKGVHVPVNLSRYEKQNTYRKIEPFVKKPKHRRPSNYMEHKPIINTVCPYDLDILDNVYLHVLREYNRELSADLFEVIMLLFEKTCQNKLKEQISRVLVYDQSIVCDVCQSPHSEENDEMVFCDGCNVCVHQSCYGIANVPDGPWLCQPCTYGIKVSCALCPNSGGAFKCTKSKKVWCHLSCAIWIPETTIGNQETMEPILNFNKIPAARWSLICCICHVKSGACIQCSMKTCRKAFHVTCGFKSGLQMEVSGRRERGVVFKSLCPIHGQSNGESARSTHDENEKPENEKQLLSYNPPDFFVHVDPSAIARTLGCDEEIVNYTFQYWKRKRMLNENKPLIDLEDDDYVVNIPNRMEKMVKYLISLRQDLEKVRNLCYMVTKREKLRREFHKIMFDMYLMKARHGATGKDAIIRTSANVNMRQNAKAFRIRNSVIVKTPHNQNSIPGNHRSSLRKKYVDRNKRSQKTNSNNENLIRTEFQFRPPISLRNDGHEDFSRIQVSDNTNEKFCHTKRTDGLFWQPSTPSHRSVPPSSKSLQRTVKGGHNNLCYRRRITKIGQKQFGYMPLKSNTRNLRSCSKKNRCKGRYC